MPDADPIPWYPTEGEIADIIGEVWQSDTKSFFTILGIEPLGDPPIPAAILSGVSWRQQYPPPPEAGWVRIKPGPYIYPDGS